MCERPEICHGPVRPRAVGRRAPLPVLAQTRRLGEHERTRADEAHVALQDVEQLRRLVEREAAEDAADARDAVVVGALDDRAVLAHEHESSRSSSSGTCRAVKKRPPRAGALLLEQRGAGRVEADAGRRCSTSSGDRTSSPTDAPTMSRPRRTRRRENVGWRIDISGMPPICSARAVEELGQARDDVHGHARVAAHADGVQQVLVAGARERDHHAVDPAEGDQVAERVQRAQPRDAEAAGLLARRRRCSRRGPGRARCGG